jgi:hypothetical protein
MSEYLSIVMGGPDSKPPSEIISRLKKSWHKTYLRTKPNVHPDNDPLFLAIADAIRKVPLMWPAVRKPIGLEFYWVDAQNPKTYQFVCSFDDGKTWGRLDSPLQAFEMKQNLLAIANQYASEKASVKGA